MAAAGGAGRASDQPAAVTPGLLAPRLGALAAVLAATALVSDAGEWRPVAFVVVLAVLYAIVDSMAVGARRARLSAGLVVQTTAAALLGPGPAVALSAMASLIDVRVNRIPALAAVTNVAMLPAVGLVSGVLFEAAGGALGLHRDMPAYAALVPPVYVVAVATNVALFAATSPFLAAADRRVFVRESVVPLIPWEILNCLLTTAVVLAWGLAGIAAAASLLVALVVSQPLLRSLGDYLKTSDDLVTLQEVSDRRAAEVERLSSDRDRLLMEVLHAEARERTRLAESLHDGPLQRLVALRQSAAESAPSPPGGVTEELDAAIAEARGIITAFHPEAARELGFEASLRAAVAPFPSARGVALHVRGTAAEGPLTTTVLLPLAQELLVNAVKHARPTSIEVSVTEAPEGIVLEVSDDGMGIDTGGSDRAVRAGHLGLAVVRRRVQDAGGTFEIATRADGGTRSRVVLPLSKTS
jgi:signal transduction histidine kinase